MTSLADNYASIKESIDGISFDSDEINHLFKTTPAYSSLLQTTSKTGEDLPAEKIHLDRRERAFELNSPIFLRYINFNGENCKNIEISIILASGQKATYNATQYNGYAQCSIREFCCGFQIRSKTKLSRPTLTSIKIYGFDSSTLTKARPHLNEFYSGQKEIKALSQELAENISESEAILATHTEKLEDLKSSIHTSNIELSQIQSEIEKKKETSENFTRKIGNAQQLLKNITTEEAVKSNNCKQLEIESEALNQKVSLVSQELSRLVNDRSLISDEFRDYVQEGRNQSKIYIYLMIVPCLTAVACVALLFNGAQNILFGHYETSTDKIAALLLRIPFAAVLGGIAYYSWTLAERLLNKIFDVQGERLTLAKLLVLAKDTVFSTAEQIGATQSEKLYLRTRLKIEMLKAHLSKDIGKDFKFPESRPSAQENNQ